MAQRRVRAVAEFVDKFGDQRVVHSTRKGWRLKRQTITPAVSLMRFVGQFVGQRIRDHRMRLGMSGEQLARKAGLVGGKQRIYDIEGQLDTGVRLGTLYAIAAAMDLEPGDFLPTVDEAMGGAGISFVADERLGDVQ